LTAYRFCRSDDMGLLVEAYERCRGPEDAGEPELDRTGFKSLVRDLDLWCSSCMVAFEGREPVGVLLGAKRPETTLVYALRVHPEHRRRGHGRHLLTSLSQKLAILGPPNLVAEIPAGREAASAAFSACGWKPAGRLTDWRRDARGPSHADTATASNAREALAPVGFEDLEAASLLGTGPRCWQRDLPALAKHRERLSGLAFHSPDRIEAWALWDEAAAANEARLPLAIGDGFGPSVGVELASTRAEASSAPTSESEAAESEAAPMPLLALGSAPGALGRLGLAAVLDELGRLAGDSPLLLPRVAPGELDEALLEELGFERGGEHLLFTSRAQAA
jgi:GNAT superfamily N-acetyltransferase